MEQINLWTTEGMNLNFDDDGSVEITTRLPSFLDNAEFMKRMAEGVTEEVEGCEFNNEYHHLFNEFQEFADIVDKINDDLQDYKDYYFRWNHGESGIILGFEEFKGWRDANEEELESMGFF
ncbi:hypothetical protein CGI18_07155 [Vibrio parahaemolyticus]|uniref:hypothetical protein n=1 Tax=Vibrio parahaemolyticus TaxID=670 RepID=UPI001123CD38|nr:hypothetical protein [Vibrio parahaemolyticus]TOK48262.1 hypothetical protein CGI18_07155 [Vibrio parahaemolyticus]